MAIGNALRATVATCGLCAASAAAAQQGGDWTGFRLGLTGAGFVGHATDIPDGAPTAVFGISGAMFGAIARLDYDVGGFVAGIGIERTYNTVGGAYIGDPNSGSFHLDHTTSVLFRAGYGGDRDLVYVQFGFNFSQVTSAGGPTASQDADTVWFHSGLSNGYGRHIGVGVERMFGSRVSGFAEYRFVNIGDELIDLGPTNPGTAHFVAATGHSLRAGILIRIGR